MKTSNENLQSKYSIFKNGIPSYIRSNKTVNKIKFRTINNCLKHPEVEYVTKLNFFSPTKVKNGKQTLFNLTSAVSNIFLNTKKTTKDNETSLNDNNNSYNENENKTTNELNEQYYCDDDKEKLLEKERKDLEIKITKVKNLLVPLNKDLKDILLKIENLKFSIDALQNMKTLKTIEKSLIRNYVDNTKKEKEKEKENKEKLPLINKQTEEFLDVMVLKHRIKLQNNCKEYKLKLKYLIERKNVILKKIEACECDLKEFKEEKNAIIDELLVHYHKLLMEGKETRREGLSWIIRAIWNLKSNVLLGYLPKFLDEKAKSFLFLYALKKNKLSLMEEKIKELFIKIKESEEKNNLINQNRKKIKRRNVIKKSDSNSNSIKNSKESFTINNELEDVRFNTDGNKCINEKIKIKYKKAKSFILNDESFSNNNNNLTDINNLNHHINNLNLIPNSKRCMHEYKYNDNPMLKFTEFRNFNYFLIAGNKNNFNDIFTTSLYNNKTQNTNDLKNYFLQIQKKNYFQKEKSCALIDSKVRPIFINKKILESSNFNIYSEEKKIKLKDFENMYKGKKDLNDETLKLYDEKKNAEAEYKNLKNEIDNMARIELNRISKCFYLEDYAEKYDISQKDFLAAIIGEEEAKYELDRQLKESKDYFIVLKKLRNAG